MKTTQQRGVVLLMTLMVLAVVATLSMYTLKHLDRSVALVTFRQDEAIIRQQLLGGEAWASAWFARHYDALANVSVPKLDQPWHLLSQEFAMDRSTEHLQIDVVERQACINLNLLGDAARAALTEQRLARLSNALSLDSTWIAVLKDWIDNDQDLTSADSHEDEYYLGLEPAFRSADSALVDASELALLPIPESVFTRLAPYTCWRPEGDQINLNRLNEPLIKAYFPTLDEQKSAALLARLASSGFDSVEAFLAWPDLSDEALNPTEWRMESRYIEVYVTLNAEQTKRFLHSRLRRLDDGRVVAFARAFEPFDVLSNTLTQRNIETNSR